VIKRAAWLRDQILEFHLPFPRTYNWPWNCDSILLWYCPNTSAKEKRSSQNIHIRQNIHIIHYVNVKCPFSPFRTLNSDFAVQRKFRNFSSLLMMKISLANDENFYRIWNLTNKIGVFNLLQMTKYWLGTTRKAKAAEVKTGNQIDKIKLQMHPDLKSLSVIQFMFLS